MGGASSDRPQPMLSAQARAHIIGDTDRMERVAMFREQRVGASRYFWHSGSHQ
jgi:hypothetical protein